MTLRQKVRKRTSIRTLSTPFSKPDQLIDCVHLRSAQTRPAPCPSWKPRPGNNSPWIRKLLLLLCGQREPSGNGQWASMTNMPPSFTSLIVILHGVFVCVRARVYLTRSLTYTKSFSIVAGRLWSEHVSPLSEHLSCYGRRPRLVCGGEKKKGQTTHCLIQYCELFCNTFFFLLFFLNIFFTYTVRLIFNFSEILLYFIIKYFVSCAYVSRNFFLVDSVILKRSFFVIRE